MSSKNICVNSLDELKAIYFEKVKKAKTFEDMEAIMGNYNHFATEFNNLQPDKLLIIDTLTERFAIIEKNELFTKYSG